MERSIEITEGQLRALLDAAMIADAAVTLLTDSVDQLRKVNAMVTNMRGTACPLIPTIMQALNTRMHPNAGTPLPYPTGSVVARLG